MYWELIESQPTDMILYVSGNTGAYPATGTISRPMANQTVAWWQ